MAEWWGPIAAGAGFAGAVGAFGYFMDNKLDDAFRAKVRAKLTRVPPEGDATGDDDWPRLFLAMFDRLFDPKGKGQPRFWRATVPSILLVAALFVAWGVLLPERVEEATRVQSLTLLLAFIMGYVVPINIVGDYFSLWESRFVIHRMAGGTGAIRKVAFLVSDLIATVGIFVVALAWSVSGFWFFWGGRYGYLDEYLAEMLFSALMLVDQVNAGGLLFSAPNAEFDIIVICFYTTLFTSVWVWLFILGGVLWPLFTWLRGVLGVDKYPVGSAMAIGGVFGGLVVTALGYVRMAALS